MSTKIFVEMTLSQRGKDVRYFAKLRLCNVTSTLTLRCHNFATMSHINIATTLSNNLDKTFISNKLATSTQPTVRHCGKVVTTALCLVGGSLILHVQLI